MSRPERSDTSVADRRPPRPTIAHLATALQPARFESPSESRIARSATAPQSASSDVVPIVSRIAATPSTVIRRLATRDVDKRAEWMDKGLTQLFGKPEYSGLSAGHEKLVRDKTIETTRSTFGSRPGDSTDNDGMYAPLIGEAKAKISEIKAATAELDRVKGLGGDYSPAVAAAQTAVEKAIAGYGDDISSTTTKLTDALKAIGSSLSSRMKTARTEELSLADFEKVTDQTTPYTNALKQLAAAIEAGKKTAAGIDNPRLNAIQTSTGTLKKMRAIDAWSEDLRDTFKGPTIRLKAVLADGVHKVRHLTPLAATRAAVEAKYQKALDDWYKTPEGNDASAVPPTATGDESAVSGNLDDHIFKGNINGLGQASGVHHKAALGGKVRLVGDKTVLGKGFYSSSIEIKNGAGGWVAKGPQSTFFPDNWSRTQVKEQITRAWNAPGKIVNGSKWTSVIDGLTYKGYFDGAGPTAAWVEF